MSTSHCTLDANSFPNGLPMGVESFVGAARRRIAGTTSAELLKLRLGVSSVSAKSRSQPFSLSVRTRILS